MRRTKIVATLGPATDQDGMLARLIEAGLDAARLNYSHGDVADHARRARAVRAAAAAAGREIGLIADLQGPKIRLECFRDGPVTLVEGARFVIDAELGDHHGTQAEVGVTYKALPGDVHAGDTLLVDDGRIVLQVERVQGARIETTVQIGGPLSNHKGINRQGGGLSAPALTHKDREDLVHALAHGADYIAVSFPRTAEDIESARQLIKAAGGRAGIIAKMERAEALDHAAEIIAASDCIMIARGDLGVEIGDARLPPAQKMLVAMARRQFRTVITATQMMESMIEHPLPTRAEVFDVANAVLDGTDAVMLSGETSVGAYPDKAVAAMSRICLGAEREWSNPQSSTLPDVAFERVDQAIAMSAIYCGNRMGVKAIAALTESGATPLWMSRVNTAIPIFALAREAATLRRVTLYRDVVPVEFDFNSVPYDGVTQEVLRVLKARGAVSDGDRVIITKGDLHGYSGSTNGLKIVTVGEAVAAAG
ncbi:MAG: pyruvate kinase [Gammaproteobacteria bacterium]|nr:pyruvate kinase [Gammaproteobacteria bacterium]